MRSTSSASQRTVRRPITSLDTAICAKVSASEPTSGAPVGACEIVSLSALADPP